MNDQMIAISSLAMDLKRVSLGLQNASIEMSRRFVKEALRRKKEIDPKRLDPYIATILLKMKIRADKNLAEDTLMYSTLLQDYVLWKTNLTTLK